jgi:SAM-dependent methyltransferase
LFGESWVSHSPGRAKLCQSEQAQTMNLAASVLEHTFLYRMWQAPFAEQKFAPVMARNDFRYVRRVLDVACGPGTNTGYFAHTGYLGIDSNEFYVRDAQRRHRRDFVVADVRNYAASPEDRFDMILVNSFLHHLDTDEVCSVLSRLRLLLTEEGHIHILELVLPDNRSVARLLARWDRGKYARPLDEWRRIFGVLFEPVLFEPYRLTGMGMTLWNMVYFKGKAAR